MTTAAAKRRYFRRHRSAYPRHAPPHHQCRRYQHLLPRGRAAPTHPSCCCCTASRRHRTCSATSFRRWPIAITSSRPTIRASGRATCRPRQFTYTFDRFAELVDGLLDSSASTRYAIYVMDYGAPVGWRLALKHPERVTGLIVQNGNAYEEGLTEFWDPIKAYWADGSDAHREALRRSSRRDDEVPVHRRRRRRQPHQPRQLGAGPGAARSPGQRRDPAGSLLRLPHQPAALSEGAGLPARAPPADPGRLGQERQIFPPTGPLPTSATCRRPSSICSIPATSRSRTRPTRWSR